ncbi:SGNH/GDSL hydrolase family protein [Mycetocola zhadangensis]|nr:SGNH/GDSL hydrolase family protein [Mycetocola zhadangensis]GGE99192.1 hypothetical protein GCM10011313_22680 [Mycetocola zhadangensis]
MAKRANRQASLREWFAEFGQYLLLVIVASITIFLVVLAFNRPASAPTNSSVRPLTSADTEMPTPTPTPTPTGAPLTVAFLGDSSTSGEGTTSTDNRWTSQLAAKHVWTEMNAGIARTGYGTPGETQDALPYTERVPGIVAASPDIVLVSGGFFDSSAGSSPAVVNAAIVETFTELRAGLPEAEIVAISPLWDASDTPPRLTEIIDEVRAAVEAVDGTFLDIGQPLDGEPQLIAAEHSAPNDEGHAVLFDTIRDALAPILDEGP